MKNNNIFTGVLILSAVVVVGILLFSHSDDIHMGGLSHEKLNKNTDKVIVTNTVTIKNYAYSPRNIKVKKGTTVTWINEDLVPHTVTISDKNKTGPDSSNFGKGKKYSFTFKEVGKYNYYCKPHPYMKADVEVVK